MLVAGTVTWVDPYKGGTADAPNRGRGTPDQAVRQPAAARAARRRDV